MDSRAVISNAPSVRFTRRRFERRRPPPLPTLRPETTTLSAFSTKVARYVYGRVITALGSCNVLIGMATGNKFREATGHRQRVVGVLQVNCGVDKRTAEAFVVRWLSRQSPPVVHER